MADSSPHVRNEQTPYRPPEGRVQTPTRAKAQRSNSTLFETDSFLQALKRARLHFPWKVSAGEGETCCHSSYKDI